MKPSFSLSEAQRRCVNYRRAVLALSKQVPALHIAPAFSCLEMVDVIYNELMRRDAHNNFMDTFVLSKGHGCVAQYVVLHELGILTDDDMKLFCLPGGCLGAHPDYEIPGVAASTGSLGHGFGLSVGMSYANKLTQQDVNTYVIISDGEMQEGSTWEAIMMASNLRLNNLTVMLDLNDRTSLDQLSEKFPAFYPVADKLKAFNWQVHEVDGHDATSLVKAARDKQNDRPLFIVCRTKKGKGISYMEDVAIWHYRSPNEQEYQLALDELSMTEKEILA